MITAAKLYKIGDIVEKSGMYVCVPCGFLQNFEIGTKFTTCLACMAGTEMGPQDFQNPADEFWQFIG